MTRVLIVGLLAVALVAGGLLYWLQIYAYYYPVTAAEAGNVQLMARDGGEPTPVAFENWQGIDSDSSPVRFRACFDVTEDPAGLAERFETYPDATPLVAPRWFDCFDAEATGEALERGEATAYLGVRDLHYGIDRIVAVWPDGHAVSWQQINACGAVVFEGEPAPEGCAEPPEGY